MQCGAGGSTKARHVIGAAPGFGGEEVEPDRLGVDVGSGVPERVRRADVELRPFEGREVLEDRGA